MRFGLLIFFFFCLVCSALVEYKNISGKTLQESIEGEMSGVLEELLVAIGTFNSLRILLCETPHCQFLMYGIMYTIYEQSIHFSSNIMLCKNHFCLSLAVKCVKSVPAYFAECLYESMKVS